MKIDFIAIAVLLIFCICQFVFCHYSRQKWLKFLPLLISLALSGLMLVDALIARSSVEANPTGFVLVMFFVLWFQGSALLGIVLGKLVCVLNRKKACRF